MSKTFEAFFKNENLVFLIDQIAQRYGMTPHQVLTEMTVYEFSFNVAVFVASRLEEEKLKKPRPKGLPKSYLNKDGTFNWGAVGIQREVQKKGE